MNTFLEAIFPHKWQCKHETDYYCRSVLVMFLEQVSTGDVKLAMMSSLADISQLFGQRLNFKHQTRNRGNMTSWRAQFTTSHICDLWVI